VVRPIAAGRRPHARRDLVALRGAGLVPREGHRGVAADDQRAQHGGLGSVDLGGVVRQGVFRWAWFGMFLGALAVPLVFVAIHAASFRRRRWQNANAGSRALSPGNTYQGDDDDD